MPQHPLNDEELKDVRQILKENDRKGWFWSSVRQVALWVTAVVIGVNHGWTALIKLVRFLSSQDSGE